MSEPELRSFRKPDTELDCRPGDVSHILPGHDAWVVGDEPAIFVDFQGVVDPAKSL